MFSGVGEWCLMYAWRSIGQLRSFRGSDIPVSWPCIDVMPVAGSLYSYKTATTPSHPVSPSPRTIILFNRANTDERPECPVTRCQFSYRRLSPKIHKVRALITGLLQLATVSSIAQRPSPSSHDAEPRTMGLAGKARCY